MFKNKPMNSKETFYPETIFGGFTDIDGTVAFFNRVNSLLEPSFVVLDVGCGRGGRTEDPVIFRKNLTVIKGKVAKVIGIDIDKSSQDNPFVDEFRHIQDDSWPVESDSINIIVCDYVLEHISNPNKFFLEIRRVLKNNGYLCIRTPNRWSYVSIVARLIPNKFHSRVTSLVQDDRKKEDVFPTVYNCNSIRKLKRIMKKNGFNYAVYGYEAEPSYLSFSKIAFFLGVMYQKFAPGFAKTTILAFGKIKKNVVQ